MSQMKVFPNILVHQFLSGASVSGVEPAGSPLVDSEETLSRGRYRKYSDLTDGGRVSFPFPLTSVGFRIMNVLFNCPGITAAQLYIEDEAGVLVSAGAMAITNGLGYNEFRNGGILVGPDFKFQVVGTGTLSGAGKIEFHLGQGWGQPVPSEITTVGSQKLPPPMERT